MQNDSTSNAPTRENIVVGHVTEDPNVVPVALVAGGLALVVAVVLVATIGLMKYFAAREPLGSRQSPLGRMEAWQPTLRTRFPEPRLEVNPARDLKTLQAGQMTELTSYGWLNRTAGVVRIPIQRAMDVVLERGLLPVRGSNSAAPTGRSSLELMHERARTGGKE